MKKSFYLFIFLSGILFFPLFQSFAQDAPDETKTYTHELTDEERAKFYLVGKDFLETGSASRNRKQHC